MFWQNIHAFDQEITLAINSWNSAITDPFWAFMSQKLVWVPMYVAIIALLVWKLGWKKAGIAVIGVILTIVFCDQFANLLKNSVCRIRPVNDESMVARGLHILEYGGGYSFFSAHAANSFGLAACTHFILKKCLTTSTGRDIALVKGYGWWMYIWASLVAISRIFVGRHYCGDVIVGTIVGVAGGLFIGWLTWKVIQKVK